MIRILIFIGLKLAEILGVVLCFVVLGCLLYGMSSLLAINAAFGWSVIVGGIIIVGVLLFMDDIKRWIRWNWEKAGKLSNKKADEP